MYEKMMSPFQPPLSQIQHTMQPAPQLQMPQNFQSQSQLTKTFRPKRPPIPHNLQQVPQQLPFNFQSSRPVATHLNSVFI